MNFFDLSFWQGFVSNSLATFLGALVGIPIALWISTHQGRKEEVERKRKILRLLKHELLMNFGTLAHWKKRDEQISNAAELHIFLQTEHWRAFSDGGELQWIKDPTLLSEIAEAYNFIRMTSEASNQFINLAQNTYRGSGITSDALTHLWKLIDEGAENTKFEITKAVKSIENAEKVQ